MAQIIETLLTLLATIQLSYAIEPVTTRLRPETRAQYAYFIAREARAHDLDPLVVAAVMWHESAFRNIVVKHTEDYGLLQVHWQPGRHQPWLRGLTRRGLLDPETNIRAGVGELAWWRRFCERRCKDGPHKHFWVGHYKSGVVVESRRYGRRVWGRYKKLLRSRHNT